MSGRLLLDKLQRCGHWNELWACAVVEELVRCGVSLFVVCPGSRSTPLVVAVRERLPPVAWISCLDERSAGFLAVGWARACGADEGLAAVITSSGTAVANLLPAAVEAHADSLPVILLTADRPPELRDNGSNQSIDQVKIFGSYSRWFKDIPCPCSEVSLQNLLSDIDYAVAIATGVAGGGPGPVHLNFMFREPLAPFPSERCLGELVTGVTRWAEHSRPFTEYWVSESTIGERGLQRIWCAMRRAKKGLVLVGRTSRMQNKNWMMEFLNCLGWPVVCDVLCGLQELRHKLTYFDFILQSQEREHIDCDFVLQLGARLVSKRLPEWLRDCTSTRGTPFVVVDDRRHRFDEHFCCSERIISSPQRFCHDLLPYIKQEPLSSELYRLVLLGERVIDPLLDKRIRADVLPTEPDILRLVAEYSCRSGSPIFVGNSMPIRDLSLFAPSRAQMIVEANRGASGIDGVLSSAIGYSLGLQKSLILVIGDVSLIHDINAFHLLRTRNFQTTKSPRVEMVPPMTVVIINNAGGGIFSFLPIARHPNLLNPLFSTPHDVNFQKAGEAFELDFVQIVSTQHLLDMLERRATLLSDDGNHFVLEIQTSQSRNVSDHQEIGAEIVEAINHYSSLTQK
eukprot:CAMPEP_0184685720 /NCGR_PEP_ID=MMETSP0312-20130426/19903_1 /TAXON_ID=31354 /ORGANISM="Compsopogon coeruleus, Strain SAG 36.94" /LENGTH=624 /DNA_ID=CAMNT_0027140081 /DNA_START=12 /DNA_END=1886 /DNA_ORIENTATION=-